MLTVKRLREKLDYDPLTGRFTHKITEGRAVAGREANTVHNRFGHLRVKIDGKAYLAHRAAWFHMTGEWPVGHLDHINQNPADNRWENLRCVTRGQNIANSRVRKDNTSGFKGVSYSKSKRRWAAHCGGKYLGSFDTPEAARDVYALAALARWGEVR